jgi:hypothetical protein
VDVVNNGLQTYVISATRINNGQNYQFTINPGTQIHQAVPQGAATKLGLTIIAGGKLDGVLWSMASQAL